MELEEAKAEVTTGQKYINSGNYAAAEASYRRVLQLYDSAAASPGPPDKSHALHQLGLCLTEQGQCEEGFRLLTESLDIQRNLVPGNKSNLAATLSWLARSLMDQHKYRDASLVYEEKLEIEKHLGPGREAITARARKNLNICKEKQADVAKQTSDHQQAVQNEQRELTVSVSPDSRSSQTLRRDPGDDLVRQLISQVEQLTLEKEASREQQRMMRDERDVATRRATELEQEVRSLREEIASSLEEKNNEIDSLQQRVDTERQSKETLMRKKERVESELSEKDREARHLSKQKNDLEVRLSAEASVNASLNLEASAARANINEQQKEIDHLNYEIENLQYQLNEERRERRAVEEQLTVQNIQNQQGRESVLTIPTSDVQLSDQTLGSGSYGVVRIGWWRSCPVAVKMLHKVFVDVPRYIHLLQQEVSVAWAIHHPNIVAIWGVTLQLEGNKKEAWVIMELLQGSMSAVMNACKDDIRPLTLREKVDMAIDACRGLDYIHSLPVAILHGDIRPSNVLVTEMMTAKLGDLGAARFVDAKLSAGPMSAEYSPPEQISGRLPHKTKETDVYRMGISLCELFTGEPPGLRERRLAQIRRIDEDTVRTLCAEMVKEDPNKRESAAYTLTALCCIRETVKYKECRTKRMVKGGGEGMVTLADTAW